MTLYTKELNFFLFFFPYKISSIGIKIKVAKANIQIVYNIFHLNKYRSSEKGPKVSVSINLNVHHRKRCCSRFNLNVHHRCQEQILLKMCRRTIISGSASILPLLSNKSNLVLDVKCMNSTMSTDLILNHHQEGRML